MPAEVTWINVLQLSFLLLAVPLQYLLTKTSSEVDRQQALNGVLRTINRFKTHFLNVESWTAWCKKLFFSSKDASTLPPPEVLEQKSEKGYYGTSDEPRSPRPSHVKFRVGQVVKHKFNGYKGVIVGWDETAQAPESWLKQMHPKDKPHWRLLPNYAVLVDTRDRFAPQLAYVVEENIELASSPSRVFHPLVDHYFENFDGAQYLPRPWLRTIYPLD